MMRGVVCMPHGWGHGRAGVRLAIAAEHAGVSINDVVDDQRIDVLTGTAVLNGTPVDVLPVASQISAADSDTATRRLNAACAANTVACHPPGSLVRALRTLRNFRTRIYACTYKTGSFTVV